MTVIRRLVFVLGLLSIVGLATADVTIVTGAEPKALVEDASRSAPVSSVDQFFRSTLSEEFSGNNATIILSSYNGRNISTADGIRVSADSFVRGALQAWGEHQHLVIRPDEVWFTILVQMNFYMNKHAEDVRDIFVDFEGQETISVEGVTWYQVLSQFKNEIQKRVKTDWLLDWIMPNFTTTTDSDVMTANILMMGLTKAYFKFEGHIICGLPSITLLGTKADWQAVVDKLGHLADFGAEPEAYSARLRPILTRFVSSFDEPNSADTLSFWNSIATAVAEHICGGPPYSLTGWITGFFFWDTNGELFAQSTEQSIYSLDGVAYPWVAIDQLPLGYAKAPLKMVDYPTAGENTNAYVLAGTLGKQITPGVPPGYLDAIKNLPNSTALLADANSDKHSTLKPLSAWLLYGPVDYNATIDSGGNLEMNLISAGIGRNQGESQCAAQQQALTRKRSSFWWVDELPSGEAVRDSAGGSRLSVH